jgi:hypothetical protein
MVSALSPAPINSGVSLFRETFANGVTIIKPITATGWGTKGFYVEDPDGYIIGFGGRPVPGSTGCISFASETRCGDCTLWAIARALLLYAECGSVVGLAGFL